MDRDEALPGELLEGLANRRPAETQHRREGRLRKHLAGRKRERRDPFLKRKIGLADL
nr:hypothetical protein [Methylobacterium soli]